MRSERVRRQRPILAFGAVTDLHWRRLADRIFSYNRQLAWVWLSCAEDLLAYARL